MQKEQEHFAAMQQKTCFGYQPGLQVGLNQKPWGATADCMGHTWHVLWLQASGKAASSWQYGSVMSYMAPPPGASRNPHYDPWDTLVVQWDAKGANTPGNISKVGGEAGCCGLRNLLYGTMDGWLHEAWD